MNCFKRNKIHSISYKDINIIECNNCNKCYRFDNIQDIILCNNCDKYYCCGILGECIGKKCKYLINGKYISGRYCKNCAVLNDNSECVCKECL